MVGTNYELLTNCKFYFEAESISDKLVLEISGLSVECPVAGGNKVQGSGKGGVKLRQATPTYAQGSKVKVKVALTSDMDLYDWYKMCNDNAGGSSNWQIGRRAASVSAYDQAGSMQARWELVKAYPYKYEGPIFKSEDEELANETIHLVHQGLKRVR